MKADFRYLRIISENALIYNPILTQIIGLCPVIAIATTLKNSVTVAIASSVLVIVMEILASAFMKKVVRYIRVAVYFIVSVILLAPIMVLFENQTDDMLRNVSAFLPLLAVSSFVVVRCEKFAVKNSIKASVIDSLASAFGYSVVLIISGVIREIFGKGTVWGTVIFENPPLPGLAQPFGGFVILGFLAAILSMIVAKFFPYYSEDIIFRFKTTESKRYSVSVYNPDKEREEAAKKELEAKLIEAAQEEVAESVIEEEPEIISEAIAEPDEEKQEETYFEMTRNDVEHELFSRSVEDIIGDILNTSNSDGQEGDNV